MRSSLPSSERGSWPTPKRIAAAAAVAHPHEQVAGAVEGEGPAVVVRERLVDAQQDALAAGVRSTVHDPELAHDRGAVVARGVVHEHARILGHVRMECQPKEAVLAAGHDPVRDVEERFGEQGPRGVHDPYASSLLDDVELVGAIAGRA